MPAKRPFSLFDFYTVKDVFGVWRKSWKQIALGVIALALLGAYWSLSEPIRYTAEASFREKNHSRGAVASSTLSALLLSQSGESNDSSAISTMKSRTMMESIIRSEGLQASISPADSGKSLLGTIMDNLRIEYALFMNKKVHVIKDPVSLLKVEDVNYNGEIPVGYQIEFLDNSTYTVKGNISDATGKIGQKFSQAGISFTLVTTTKEPLKGKTFNLLLRPLQNTAQDLSKLINITTDKDDGSLLRIKYRNENRQDAVSFINSLMSMYQAYIDTDHKKMMATQINYLQRRQNEVFATLNEKMHDYAETLSDDFASLGFIDTQRAMEFLAANQHAIKSKQFAISMEMQRLDAAKQEGKKALELLSGAIDNPFINKLVGEIRDLKQQYDSIHVALSSSNSSNKPNLKSVFEENMSTLTKLKQSESDAQELIAELEKGKTPSSIPHSLSYSDYMVQTWQDKLLNDPSTDIRQKFLAYLHNLTHHFQVYSKALEENLAHQHSPTPELQGITLSIANDLFLTYSKESNQIEGQILQYNFIIQQLQQPDFELSSLSAILNDPVSHDIANNASTLALALNDRSNRTDKEISRLQEDLKLQRKFLSIHLKQAKELLEIKQNLFQEKLQEIRQTTLAIIQQNIGVAENQITDQIRIRQANLQQELALLERQQEELQNQMAVLPKKWVSEQLIHQHMEMHRQMSREITNLVESKNISSNLEIMQSAPVDIAIAPLHPDSPRLAMLSILGAFAGIFIMGSWTLFNAMRKGIPASDESLRLMGVNVAGTLSETTVKRATAMFLLDSSPGSQHTILVAQGKEKSIADQIAKFFLDQGISYQKVEWKASVPISDAQWIIAYTDLSPAAPEILVRFEHFDYFLAFVQNESLNDLEPLIETVLDRKKTNKTSFITY